VNNNDLREKIEMAPHQPGVYQFRNATGKVIYVGKAKVLKQRVRSYFQDPRQLSAKTRILVRHIAAVDYIVTDSEVEALILENNLIKKLRPRYNISLKDDKTFPYIRITNEAYPRVFVTRKLERDGSSYIGPFTQVKILRQQLQILQETFRIRTCRYPLDDANVAAKKYPLCLEYQIGNCDGPCQDLISRSAYNKIIAQVRAFLQGKTGEVIAELESEMQTAAAALDYEQARYLRDRIRTLTNYAGNRQKVEAADLTDRDIIGLAHEDNLAAVVVFQVRAGKIINKQNFRFANMLHADDSEILRSFLEDYYLNNDLLPEEILLPQEIADMSELQAYLHGQKQNVNFVFPKIGGKRKLLALAEKNARYEVEDLKLERLKKRKDYIAHNVLSLQRDLSLEVPPKHMECFDISNIQGTDAVASMVCFIDGKAKKSEYRIFTIRSKNSPDDFAMLYEAVLRRYSRLQKEKQKLPDLIVIDGGKGQLNAARRALEEIGLAQQAVISLAKRLEEVFIPGFSEAQNIPKTSSSLKLLQQIRDEAHRFAVSHHRRQRKRRTLHSRLDRIPGVGPQRREQLIRHFGSIKKVAAADLDDLKAVPGLPQRIAEAVYEYFHREGEA
jgi:excinuclease ABC subunit C